MHEDVDDVIALRSTMVPPGLNRLVTISFAAHVLVVAALALMPRGWFAPPEKRVMTVSLAGTPGERTTGMNPVSGKQVDQVAPTPRRPEPPKPIETAKPDTIKVPEKPVPKPEPAKKPVEAKPEPTKPVATGKQLSQGTAKVETGAKTQNTGLTVGGGLGGGAITIDAGFCCPQFVDAMIRQIQEGWNEAMPARGITVVKFTVHRDGRITDKSVAISSGNPLLDIESASAIPDKLRMGLPPQFLENQLVVQLTFTYER